MTQLKARVTGLQFAIRECDTGDDLLRGERMARIRAAQDHLAVLSEQVAIKRPYGAVDADLSGTAPQRVEPSAKLQRHDYGRRWRRGEARTASADRVPSIQYSGLSFPGSYGSPQIFSSRRYQ